MGDDLREVLDEMSYGMISYLESHEYVARLDIEASTPISELSIRKWEKSNFPLLFPDDLKAFLLVSNGLSLKWFVEVRGNEKMIGNLFCNAFEEMRRFELLGCYLDMMMLKKADVEETRCVAFVLESSPYIGDICLMYSLPKNDDKKGYWNKEPQVWQRDLLGKWSFIAKSFTAYYRLQVAHLGLSCWQNIFSLVGVDPVSKQWMRLFIPKRLKYDEKQISKSKRCS